MIAEALNSLWEIGQQLDRHQYPCVYDEGIVQPTDTAVVQMIVGEGSKHEQATKPRTSAFRPRTWQWTEARKRSFWGPWPPRPAPFVRSSNLSECYQAQLGEVLDAYPGTQVFHQDDGMWLLTDSSVVHGLGKKATFLIAFPYSPLHPVKSWGFWTTPVSNEWIGPRHTNFPDGSVCATTPNDNSWSAGGSIVTLLDIYSVWAARQEYLRNYGYWPGDQAAHFPYERILELQDNEICGCDTKTELYKNCCKPKDAALDKLEVAIDYFTYVEVGGFRSPPKPIVDFIRSRNQLLPRISEVSMLMVPEPGIYLTEAR